MKERAVSRAGQPALIIARTVCWLTRAGSDSGSVDGSSGPRARMGPGDGAGVPGSEGVVEGNHAPWEAVAERDAELDAGEVYIRFGDGSDGTSVLSSWSMLR
jgi:hypothetical protein